LLLFQRMLLMASFLFQAPYSLPDSLFFLLYGRVLLFLCVSLPKKEHLFQRELANISPLLNKWLLYFQRYKPEYLGSLSLLIHGHGCGNTSAFHAFLLQKRACPFWI